MVLYKFFLTLNAQSILPRAGNKCYAAKIEESEKAGRQESNPGHLCVHAVILQCSSCHVLAYAIIATAAVYWVFFLNWV